MALLLTAVRSSTSLEIFTEARIWAGPTAQDPFTASRLPALPGNTAHCTVFSAYRMAPDRHSALWPSTTVPCLEALRAADTWALLLKSGHARAAAPRLWFTPLVTDWTVTNQLAEWPSTQLATSMEPLSLAAPMATAQSIKSLPPGWRA